MVRLKLQDSNFSPKSLCDFEPKAESAGGARVPKLQDSNFSPKSQSDFDPEGVRVQEVPE